MLIRVDDYPTGIRPIQPEQMEMFDRMLSEFERNGIELHLGVVPKTIEKTNHIPKHRNLVICQHGYEHGYDYHSDILIKNGDIFNHDTFGSFDEFQDVSDSKIEYRIKSGKETLERIFSCKVDTYIPCCNTISNRLVRILTRLGFNRILCENKAHSRIPVIQSDFYGKLDDLDFGRTYSVITIHITWEWDTIRAKGFDYWSKLVKKLAELNIVKNTGNPYKILFKYPIRYRKDKFFATLDLYYALMANKTDFEFLVTVDRDDEVMCDPEVLNRICGYRNMSLNVGNCHNKIEAVNDGIVDCGDWEPRKWDIVVIVSDDMIPKVAGYDNVIRNRMSEAFPDTDGALWFNDGFQKDHINTLQIMGRKWFDRWGFVYHEDYVSQRCDVEYQMTAKRFNRIKYYPECIIRHEHADFGLIPYDRLLIHNYTFIKRDEEVFKAREKIGFPVGIPKTVHFIWSKGTPLTYLRYLTYVTWKKHNPDWKVMFHLVEGCGTVKTWQGSEELEFMGKKGKDYLNKIPKSEIIYELVDGILPNYSSDLIRWKSLYEYGGFYLDLDQLILKSFDPLTEYDVIWGGTKINYSGVMGMFKRCPIALNMYNRTKEKIESGTKNYCEAGNWLWDAAVKSQTDFKFYKTLCAPMRWFYPIEQSFMMKIYYQGEPLELKDSYAVHWFGGHPDSQEFGRRSETEINKIINTWQ